MNRSDLLNAALIYPRQRHEPAYEPRDRATSGGRDRHRQDEALHHLLQIVSLKELTAMVTGAESLVFRRCAPRLAPEAAEKLSSHFVALRKQVQQVERE